MNLPTWITLSRLLAIPVVFWVLANPTVGSRWWAVAVFLLAACTDWLDGYLARRLNQVTELGKFLDPLVDKLLVLAPLMVLVQLGTVPAWGVFLILARELTIAGWRVGQVKVVGANLWGKVKTVIQIVAIAVLLSPLSQTYVQLSLVLFWLAVAITWWSGLVYLIPRSQTSTP
ncbi:CDP-diacylglycerol--glycerol-3-phosphate 3-phosphatidyltransferase [Leptothoe kymatousa]|uniref:CDP-diacylglycerol--glycerol-3-phosphate 3-phosphatidyltransferase n=1 Tax=Leptothoe kymatousa TAU-MAC 1615 TaxID=2364775 RepID=A0ABS5Y1X1_9CYAN|nr:CDP-diacylglycerol--glycerol-3-phosphate 3-phosphatidyltransferase [Leptothoe kymatousa]MBT9311824.1 CDP-diacylglycerol--glycerol-3-phosphate 3-phosphatidyltransferase [Leptothoe kymatousa TAU-MAC 1615]